MNLNNIFTSNLPTLDLHGYDRESARVAIIDFINDNKKMKNDTIIIVHGKGAGILKQTTHSLLSKNKNVKEYKIDYFNDGSTIVRIFI